MNKRRLLKLADLLEADAKNKKGIHFNIGTFGFVKDADNALSCGTSACAMGLAALSGAFRGQGLAAHLDGREVLFIWNRKTTGNGFKVAEELFGITNDDAHHLFGCFQALPGGGRGAEAEREVAKNIRKFVAGKAMAHS